MPEQAITYKGVSAVSLPAYSGRMQILPGHAETFLLLLEGDISLRQLNKEDRIVRIKDGECHVKDNVVTIVS
jgi:F0F1-type ATP synthase epsilon subunit